MERCSAKADSPTPKSGQSMIDSINWLLRATLWPEDLRQLFGLQFYFFFRSHSLCPQCWINAACVWLCSSPDCWLNFKLLNLIYLYSSSPLSVAVPMGHASIWIPRRWVGLSMGQGVRVTAVIYQSERWAFQKWPFLKYPWSINAPHHKLDLHRIK